GRHRDGRGGGPKGRAKGGRRAGRDDGRGRHSSHALDRERPAAGRSGGHDGGERRGPRLSTSRPEMIRALDRDGLLPCITFIFSRAGCDAAVEQCLRAGLDLTTAREKALVAERVEEA
ncbi:RNA helicase, partial [Xanthomonas citri pv. citri]|nr:RNA helicase [Xanthomonas citri pv. citri]